MASRFQERHAAAADRAFDALGDAVKVIHISKAGTRTSVTAIVGREKSQTRQRGTRNVLVKARTISIRTDSNTQWGYVAAPSFEDQVEIAGTVYAVDWIAAASAVVVRLELVRNEQVEQAAENYRD